jgi:hypothetical protein
MSRRRFIRICITAAAAGFLLRNPFRLVSGGGKQKWEMPDQGRIRFIKGEVYVNDLRAEIGDTVNQDDSIRTGEKSETEIELQDFAVFSIKENTTCYMCDCYGSVDLIDPGTGDVLRQVTSRYHKAVDIRKTGGRITIERQRKLYHRDRDILQISERFSRETRVFEEKEGRGSNY